MDQDVTIQQDDYNPQDWENPPTLLDLKQDLTDSSSAHESQVSRIERWLDNLHVRNGAAPKSPKGKSKAAPKLIRKQAEWRYPALSEPFLSSDEMFSVDPKTWEDVDSARQNALVLNKQIQTEVDKVRFIDDYVRAGVDEGTAIIRVGWDFREEEVTKQVPEVEFIPNPELEPLHMELAQMKMTNPTGYKWEVPEELQMAHDVTMQTGMPHEPNVVGMKEVEQLQVVKNCPTLDICDFRNVTIDPTCGADPDKASFIIYSFETSLSDLKKEGRYENLDDVRIDNNSILGTPDHTSDNTSDFNFADEPRKKVVAHEYWGFWDFNDTGIAEPFVATWIGDTLIRLEENPFPDKKLPFVFVPLLPVKGSPYGEPDGELLEDHQKVIGALTRGMIDTMAKAANGQTGMRKDMLDAVNRRKFERGEDYTFNAGVDPRQGVFTHTMTEIPASAQFLLQQQQLEAESMTGVKAFSQGINSGSMGDVAAGIRGALDAASKRENSILRRLAKGMEKVGRKIVAMNQEFLEEEQVVRITNDEFVEVRRDDLAGYFDLTLSISSAEEDNVKAQELAFMLQTMGQTMDPGMTQLLLRDIARLRKMPELAHQIENYQPQPDPVAQKMQELEVAKLEAEIQKINSEAQENIAQANAHGAKAREANANADQSNLNFIEQESGVTQEREKELRSQQAMGNIALEREKASLAAPAAPTPTRETELANFLGRNNQEN